MIFIPIPHCHIQGLSISLFFFLVLIIFSPKNLLNLLVTTIWGYTDVLHLLGGDQFILHPFSHFEKQDIKNPKFSACSALIFNIHIFRFKADAGLQVDIDLTPNLNFLVQVLSFLISLVGLEGPPNFPVCERKHPIKFYLHFKHYSASCLDNFDRWMYDLQLPQKGFWQTIALKLKDDPVWLDIVWPCCLCFSISS